MQMRETPEAPVLRPGPGSFSLQVGDEIFVPLVTDFVRSLNIRLPDGQWVDYWDEPHVVSGSTIQLAPLGREPIFFRLGAIIPMEVQRGYTGHGTRESKGSLTVLVYPNGTSTFREYESATATWTTFTSAQTGDVVTRTAEPRPRQPILYRIGRVNSRPRSVGIDGSKVMINEGGSVPEVASDGLVNGSTSAAWCYDATDRRLIVKALN